MTLPRAIFVNFFLSLTLAAATALVLGVALFVNLPEGMQ